jgi:hypothetical protein
MENIGTLLGGIVGGVSISVVAYFVFRFIKQNSDNNNNNTTHIVNNANQTSFGENSPNIIGNDNKTTKK